MQVAPAVDTHISVRWDLWRRAQQAVADGSLLDVAAAARLRAAVLDRQPESQIKDISIRYAHLPKRETALTALRPA